MVRRTIRTCRAKSRLLDRRACSARWQKRRARSCRAATALRSAMQWAPRALPLERRAPFSSSIRPRASISVAPRWALPSSADPLDCKPDRLTCATIPSRNHPIRLFHACSNAAISKRVMSLRRGFNPLAAFAPIAAGLRATAFRRVRIGTRDHRPILPFALLLMAAALVPLPGRTQESSARRQRERPPRA